MEKKKRLTVPESAEAIGIDSQTMYQWCRNDVIPHVRIPLLGKGKKKQYRIFLYEEDVERFIERHYRTGIEM
jgi:predicted site-specific integrase-resolvase